MQSGNHFDITLTHFSCGKVLAKIPVRELQEMPRIQLVDVAQELVRRANLSRPVEPAEDDGTEAFRLACFGANPRYWGDTR